MRLFHLKRINETEWDTYSEMMVRAANAHEARHLAQTDATADEDGDWLNPDITSCDVVFVNGNAGVLISDLKAG